MKLRRPSVRGLLIVAAGLAAWLTLAAAPRGARAAEASADGGTGAGGAPESAPAAGPSSAPATVRPKPAPRREYKPGEGSAEEGKPHTAGFVPKGARAPNKWLMNLQMWVRNYVAVGEIDPADRVGPWVTGVTPSIRMGASAWRFDFGVAWSMDKPNVTLYPGFRQFWFDGEVFSMWVTSGLIVTVETMPRVGIFAGPGFRWWLTHDLGVYIEAVPNYTITAGGNSVFVLEGAVGLEVGLF
ncbi:MAG TPA: hypothetical protein VG389_09805 [Myxococcota bacterium]|jgi:hypothetical protein|nr:hypothetical protein [Myxococcota bacterium]